MVRQKHPVCGDCGNLVPIPRMRRLYVRIVKKYEAIGWICSNCHKVIFNDSLSIPSFSHFSTKYHVSSRSNNACNNSPGRS